MRKKTALLIVIVAILATTIGGMAAEPRITVSWDYPLGRGQTGFRLYHSRSLPIKPKKATVWDIAEPDVRKHEFPRASLPDGLAYFAMAACKGHDEGEMSAPYAVYIVNGKESTMSLSVTSDDHGITVSGKRVDAEAYRIKYMDLATGAISSRDEKNITAVRINLVTGSYLVWVVLLTDGNEVTGATMGSEVVAIQANPTSPQAKLAIYGIKDENQTITVAMRAGQESIERFDIAVSSTLAQAQANIGDITTGAIANSFTGPEDNFVATLNLNGRKRVFVSVTAVDTHSGKKSPPTILHKLLRDVVAMVGGVAVAPEVVSHVQARVDANDSNAWLRWRFSEQKVRVWDPHDPDLFDTFPTGLELLDCNHNGRVGGNDIADYRWINSN